MYSNILQFTARAKIVKNQFTLPHEHLAPNNFSDIKIAFILSTVINQYV